jgi:hypothetical protein
MAAARFWFAIVLTMVGLAAAATARGKVPPCGPFAPGCVHCQPNNALPGIEVSNLHNITGHAACKTALSLLNWLRRHPTFLQCNGKGKLNNHTFNGWRLSISRTGFLVMTRRKAAFNQDGQDYPPLTCVI